MIRRFLLLAALIAGISYFFANRVMPHDAVLTAWKGAGVGLLALWAVAHAHSRDGWLLVLVLALGAAGDVLIDVMGLEAGAAAFLAGHVFAIALYVRNRAMPIAGALTAAVIFAAAVGAAAYALAGPTAALYAIGLGAMAGTAWTSRFSRAWVALGASLFVVSDLLIFARAGTLASSALPNLLIWPAYFFGQVLIAVGVVRGLSPRGAGPIWAR